MPGGGRSNFRRESPANGELAEWPKATVCKTEQPPVRFRYSPPNMTKEEVAVMAVELTHRASALGWNREETKVASTGSIYIELSRRRGNQIEWVVVRVATHKQVYHRWLRCISWSPFEYDEELLLAELGLEFGEVGDVFEV
jgi:hypothetical protein